jgi:hypothetical protein
VFAKLYNRMDVWNAGSSQSTSMDWLFAQMHYVVACDTCAMNSLSDPLTLALSVVVFIRFPLLFTFRERGRGRPTRAYCTFLIYYWQGTDMPQSAFSFL